jgi:glycosyltransferase involved in cell wall biosynthesis
LSLDSCVLTALYVYALLSYLTARGLRANPEPETDWEPDVSVIVVAGNKAGTIGCCLDSFGRLDYPGDKLEFILVNDRSEDGTGKWMKRFLESGRKGRLIDIEGTSGGINAGTDGLVRACRSASGEVLFFTGGDCEVPSAWIRTLLKSYAPDVGLAAGFVTLDSRDHRDPLFAQVQSLDRIHRGAIGSGWANLGYPLSVFGNNYSMRKSAYIQAGGYEASGEHWKEHFALFRSIRDRTRWRAVWAEEETCVVYSNPAASLKEYDRQRRDLAAGGGGRGIMALFLTAAVFLARLSIVVCALTGDWKLALMGFWSLLLADGLVLSQPLFALGRADLFRKLIAYEMACIGYSVFFAPLTLITGKSRRKSQI